MQKITYTNDRGESVVLTHRAPFILSKIDGLGDVDADMQLQKAPYQDGSTYIDSLLQPRFINMEVSIYGTNRDDISLKRQELGRIFNPKVGGTLLYENGRVKRKVKAYPEHVPKYPSSDRGGRHQISLVNLVCPNPYWQNANESVEQLVTFSGGLTFPLQLPTIFGNQDSTAKSRIMVNEGDSPTPIEVIFEGPATSPIRIENETTGEFIEVAQNLLVGEKLWISTAFGKKRVEKISEDGARANAFNYINLESVFFQLLPGNNLMTYDTGEEYEKAPVTIKFYGRYIAV
ncbi:MAG: phage tail family protein [Candidatus Saccharimonadales bacterium]